MSKKRIAELEAELAHKETLIEELLDKRFHREVDEMRRSKTIIVYHELLRKLGKEGCDFLELTDVETGKSFKRIIPSNYAVLAKAAADEFSRVYVRAKDSYRGDLIYGQPEETP